MKKIFVICALSCLFLANAASAALIVDTGQPPAVLGGTSLRVDHWVAGKFLLKQAYTVTNVVAWMFEAGYHSGDMTVAIYGESVSGDVPDAGSELYSHTFYADLPYATNGWVGAEGVSWDLGPGRYWAAFEVRSGDAHFALPNGAPSRLPRYASRGVVLGWYPNIHKYGFRVSGDEAKLPPSTGPVIPAPGAIVLVGIGLGGLSWLRRRRTL